MPIYEYRCGECEQVFEALQRVADEPLDTCRRCGGPAERIISSPAIHFVGSGWYVTDYARKGQEPKGEGKGEGKDGEKGKSAGEAAGAEKNGRSSGGDSSGKANAAGRGSGSGSKASDARTERRAGAAT